MNIPMHPIVGLILATACAASVSAEMRPYQTPPPHVRQARSLQSPSPAAIPMAPGLSRPSTATVAAYGCGYEPVEGFTTGWIGGQSGWSTFLSSILEGHVSTEDPASGIQHLQLAKEPTLPTGFLVGAFSPDLGPQPLEPTSVAVEVNVTDINNGANYYVTPQGPSYGLKTAEVVFELTGDIFVLDRYGGGFAYYDTYANWTPGSYGRLIIEIDPVQSEVHYFYNGTLIYTNIPGPLWGAPVVEEVLIYSDNYNLADVGNFDNLLVSPPGENELTLESSDVCAEAGPVEITLWARDLSQMVTGYQAFVDYDESLLVFNPGASHYLDDIFAQHITGMADAMVAPGSLILDGAVPNGDPGDGTAADTPLAVLVFDPLTDCATTSVDFDHSGYFKSELSYHGLPLITTSIDSPTITIDQLPPDIVCPADIEASADAGLCTAVVAIQPPTATDACTAVDPTIYYERSDDALLTDPFPSGDTTITWYVFDTCGNVATCDQTVTVNAVNEVLIDVALASVTTPTTRCLRFVTDDCAVSADVQVDFIDHDGVPSTPVRAQDVVIEIPCGSWLSLCVKDEQHTLWNHATLSIAGAQYVLNATPLLLTGGDTDNDSDVDINDVTWLLFQFGDLHEPGGCPWDGTRDADFSNNGAVGAEDYTFLATSWLTSSTCPCTRADPAAGPAARRETVLWSAALPTPVARRADLNRDGLIDYADVEIFETRHNLSGELSARMQETMRRESEALSEMKKGGHTDTR